MRLDIVIPSKERFIKLKNCLTSLDKARKNYDFKVYVYLDLKDEEPIQKDWIAYNRISEYRVPDFWNGYLQNMKADALCYLNDDIEVPEDFFDNLYKEYLENFPDYDGVLGIDQENLKDSQKVQTAFGVIGAKFADRFPSRQVFAPYYFRFYADKELELFSMSIDKLYFSRETKLTHYHPAFFKNKTDDTHVLVRKYHSLDRYTFRMRIRNKLLWGRNFFNYK